MCRLIFSVSFIIENRPPGVVLVTGHFGDLPVQSVMPHLIFKATSLRRVCPLVDVSSGSRISHWGGRRRAVWGGADLQRGHFSAKTYAKTKELDPVGGVRAGSTPLDPPMDVYGCVTLKWADYRVFCEPKMGLMMGFPIN